MGGIPKGEVQMEKTIYERSVEMHKKLGGKLKVTSTIPINTRDALSLAYTPGVAEPCKIIAKNPEAVYDYTWKGKTVAVVSDCTAVLGLGNIGAKAGLPVMEGKCALLSERAGVNAVPICLDTTDPEEIIATVKNIAPAFGAICLEDISAPRCVQIEGRLKNELDIPVFHDDQHGTAIVVTSAIINAVKVVGKEIKDLTVVVSGTGAAGSAIIKMLYALGVKWIYGFNINGIVTAKDYDKYGAQGEFVLQELSLITNEMAERISMAKAMAKADVFVGVSAPNLVTPEMVASMKRDPIIFAMANPDPEITYEAGKAAGARIMGTGRSDYPNQINNVQAFPGVFKGALECGASQITEEMKVDAAYALASLVSEEELSEDHIIADPLDERVVKVVAEAVASKARELGIARW